jgi:hypothetical protein
MLLGSALANIGAGESVARFQTVATPEDKMLGRGVGVGGGGGGVGEGAGFLPYTLAVVVKFILGFEALLPEIQVPGSLLPCK